MYANVTKLHEGTMIKNVEQPLILLAETRFQESSLNTREINIYTIRLKTKVKVARPITRHN